MRRVLLFVTVIGIIACSKNTGGPGGGTPGIVRTLVASVDFADTVGSRAEECLTARDYDLGDNCIQRVRLSTGEERVEFSPVTCPGSGLVAEGSVLFSLSLRNTNPGQSYQLFETRSNGIDQNRPIGAVSTTGRLENLCSGDIYTGLCDPQIAGKKWVGLAVFRDAARRCM